MKQALFSVVLLITQFSFSQLYGDIAIDRRPIVKSIEYGVASNYTGQIVFDIVVDEKGNVTVCRLNKIKTNVKSTPTTMKAKNRIVTQLKFHAHSRYPEFHRGQIVMKAYKKSDKND